ncbi:MAG: UDP-N-acetylglucosamine 4-epimerase, partial [Candidatus Cloacimonetes bacterium]|nr:UDP-N-acetylglucosamine 4-epimerase [Candidatus Cloacimonadota bacterium]
AVGKLFDLLAEILKKDLPLNTDRIMKFATSTDFRAEKIREMGYEQKYSTDDELSKTIKWYLTSGKTKL